MDLSFWEKSSYFTGIDVLVVGSGIVGLNTARAIKERKPNSNIMVIDRGFLPYGASTRNAGFACFGSLTELQDDLTKMSEHEVFDLVERRWEGLKKLRLILGDDNIGYEPLGGYEVFAAADEINYKICIDKLDYFNEALLKITGKKNIYQVKDNCIKDFGFGNVNHLILNSGEGQIDTGKMMKSLLKYVREIGIDVINGIDISSLEELNGEMKITTTNGFDFIAKQVVVTTNAFAKQLLPELKVEPGRAQVLITNPIKGLKVKGSFHYEKGYYYFRNVGDRILFGGGRNLDFDTERTVEFGLTNTVQNKLEELLQTMILPKQEFTVDQRWSGIMGLGKTKTTIIKKLSDHLFCAVRMGGMGIAIGTLVGEEAAELLVENS